MNLKFICFILFSTFLIQPSSSLGVTETEEAIISTGAPFIQLNHLNPKNTVITDDLLGTLTENFTHLLRTLRAHPTQTKGFFQSMSPHDPIDYQLDLDQWENAIEKMLQYIGDYRNAMKQFEAGKKWTTEHENSFSLEQLLAEIADSKRYMRELARMHDPKLKTFSSIFDETRSPVPAHAEVVRQLDRNFQPLSREQLMEDGFSPVILNDQYWEAEVIVDDLRIRTGKFEDPYASTLRDARRLVSQKIPELVSFDVFSTTRFVYPDRYGKRSLNRLVFNWYELGKLRGKYDQLSTKEQRTVDNSMERIFKNMITRQLCPNWNQFSDLTNYGLRDDVHAVTNELLQLHHVLWRAAKYIEEQARQARSQKERDETRYRGEIVSAEELRRNIMMHMEERSRKKLEKPQAAG